MQKHTPGPWIVRPNYSNGCESCPTIEVDNKAGGRNIVATCHGAPYLGFKDTNPNARLIASAPDMLKVLLHIREVVETFAEDNKEVSLQPGGALMEIISEAIAKALEGQP